MKKKKHIGAAVFMAVAIAASVPLGINRSLAKARDEAAGDYYYDRTGYIIYDGIDQREAEAKNLITVAKRYSDENPELKKLIDELEYRVEVSENTLEMDDETFTSIAAANAAMDQPARALAQALEELPLEEKDKKYPAQFIANMDSEQDKIKRSSYNDQARDYNEKLAKLKPFALLKPLAVFEGPNAGAPDISQTSVEDRVEAFADGVEKQAEAIADNADELADNIAGWVDNAVNEIFG